MTKKYCAVCTVRKGKCGDCEELPSKCTTNGNNSFIKPYSLLIKTLAYCAKRFLSIQPDFQAQKYEIEESITSSANGKHHIVIYYPKYHCKLNHIEHFWCSVKKWVRENCQYTLDDFRRRVPRTLASIPNKTILAYYYRCQRKMELYREGFLYGLATWKACIAHHKPTNKDEDQ